MSNVIKEVPLALSREYVSSWGVEEAVREFIQNGVDCDDHKIYVKEGVLHIDSYDGCLSHKNLLLGCGDKGSEGSSIGGHGEGSKLAFLVMAREGVDFEFINGKEKWVPYFKFNDNFGEDCLHISIENYEQGEDNSVCISIKGLDHEDESNFLCDKPLDSIIGNTLILQDQCYSKHETTYGDILLEPQHKGKIFCGGLFVQTIQGFQEGFNFKPEYLKLDRDRRMVSKFDIKWTTKEMWAEVAEDPSDVMATYLAENIVNGSDSMEYIDSTDVQVADNVKSKVLDLYNEKYSGKLFASSHEQKEKLVREGNANADYIGNDAFLHVLNQTEEYQVIKANTKVEKPMEWLDSWKDQFYNELSDEALYAYEDMCVKLQKVLK